MPNVKAIITGDLIGSRAKGSAAVDQAMAVLARQAERLAVHADADTRFTRYRGDGWQIYLDVPGLCLSAVLQIAAVLRADGTGLQTRQSIGIGTITALPASDLSAGHGEAFEISGVGLDHMDKSRRLMIGGRGIVMPWHEAILALADWHSARWSREQAEAMALWLRDGSRTQADLGATLGISRQAMQARLAGAGYMAWDDALHAFQSAAWEKPVDV